MGILTKLIRSVSRAQDIDARRVNLAGISNGAALAYRYGCELPFPVAAIGAVSGSLAFSCPSPHRTSVMEIHGLDHRNIPFAGGIGSKAWAKIDWLPVERTLDLFRQAGACRPPASRSEWPVRTETSQCAEGIEAVLIAIAQAGHQWPGARVRRGPVTRLLRLDPPSRALDATSKLWDFFRRHSAK